jgi:hypothetical protein
VYRRKQYDLSVEKEKEDVVSSQGEVWNNTRPKVSGSVVVK